MNIVILDGHALNPGDLDWGCLNRFGAVRHYDRTATEADAIARIGDAEIVLLNKTPITESLLAACPSIKLICVLATGYNVVDCAAAAKRGIPVCNVPDYGTQAVAQFTFALLFELCHHVGLHNDSVHNGDWTRHPDFCYWKTQQMELAGKTIGIVGYGRIGRAVAKLAEAFGMHVLAYNRTHYEGESYVTLDELLKNSDIVSLHCPLYPETKEIINADTISKMKNGAILINTARGPLLDEQAVGDALACGKLRGVAVDVAGKEPIPADSPLLAAPNCIITPHIAWAPLESRQRLLDCVVSNIENFLNGTTQNAVNL